MSDAPTETPSLPAKPTRIHIAFHWAIERVPVNKLLINVWGARNRGTQHVSICMSSPGGDPEVAFYAYNELRAIPDIELEMINVGAVQSAAVTVSRFDESHSVSVRYAIAAPKTSSATRSSSLRLLSGIMPS